MSPDGVSEDADADSDRSPFVSIGKGVSQIGLQIGYRWTEK